MSDNGKEAYLVRPLEKSDIPAISRWFRDLDDLSAFDRLVRVPLCSDSADRAWADGLHNDGRNGKFWFAIEDTGENPVGIVGLEGYNPINGDAVLSLFVAKAQRGRGIGLRAAAAVADLAFDQLGLCRVTSYYHVENFGSRRVLSRLGFEVEGCMRKAWFRAGDRIDLIAVGLLREEWAGRRGALAGELDDTISVSFGSFEHPSWCWPAKGNR